MKISGYVVSFLIQILFFHQTSYADNPEMGGSNARRAEQERIAAAPPSTAATPTTSGVTPAPAEAGCDPDRSHLVNHPDERITGLSTLMADFPQLRGALASHLETYSSNSAQCISRSSVAITMCMTCLSTHIQTGINVAQTALTALSGVSSATGQCGGLQDASKYIQGALAAYQAACGGAKALCDSACSSSKSSLTNLKAALERIKANFAANLTCANPNGPPPFEVNPATIPNCAAYVTKARAAVTQIEAAMRIIDPELNATTPGTIAKKTATCQGYTMTLISAASGIGSFALLSQQAKNCKKETAATATATQDKCAPLPGKTVIETTLDSSCLASLCSKTEYSSRTECVCYTSPRTAGCPSGLSPAGADTPGGLQATAVDPNASALQATGTTLNGTSPGAGTVNTRSAAGTDGLKGTTAGSGGAAPSAGLPGSGTAAAGEVAPSATTRPSTAMYGGESGGSGGSYSSSGYGSGGGALRSYLPGGAQDPARTQASVSAAGVTSAGGKSNFEKITDRYVENRSTLSVTGR